MPFYSFSRNTTIRLDGVRMHIESIHPSIDEPQDPSRNLVLCKNEVGYPSTHTQGELLELWKDGRLQIGDADDCVYTLDSHTTATKRLNLAPRPRTNDVDAAQLRQALLKPLLEIGRLPDDSELGAIIRSRAREIGVTKPPSCSTVRRWISRLRANADDWRSLIPRNDQKGNRTSRFNSDEQHIYTAVLDKEYLTSQQLSMTEAHRAVAIEIEKFNAHHPGTEPLRVPSIDALYRMVKRLPAYDVDKARHGRHKADAKFKGGKQGPISRHILDRVQIDHTQLDIWVVCDRFGLVLGRPWITIAIDGHSRMILGIYVTFDPPNVQSVLGAIHHSVLPKPSLKATYPRLKNEWHAFGRASIYTSDNGAELHADEIEKFVLKTLGAVWEYAPSRGAYYKGLIERFNRTLNHNFLHYQPGTTRSNYIENGDYPSEKLAVLTFNGLMELLYIWILDDYSCRIHRALRDLPRNVWNASAQNFPPSLPHSVDSLINGALRIDERQLHKTGIDFKCIRYQSNALQGLFAQIGEHHRLTFRYDYHDLGTVYVEDPTNPENLIVAHANDRDYAEGLAMFQHLAIVKKTNERLANLRKTTMRDLRDTKVKMREIVESEQASKRRSVRARAARFLGTNSQADTGNSTFASIPLEKMITHLSENDFGASEVHDLSTSEDGYVE